MSKYKKISPINEKQIETSGVVSLAIRPNQPQANEQYGVGGLSGKELQRKFDNLARLAIGRCNMLVQLLSGEYKATNTDEATSILDYILTIKKEDSELDNDMSLSDVLANILTTAGELKAKDPSGIYPPTDNLNEILAGIWDTVQFMDQNVDTLLSFAPFSMDVNYDEDGNVTYTFYNSRGNRSFTVSSDMLKGYRDFLAEYSDGKLTEHNASTDSHADIRTLIATTKSDLAESIKIVGENANNIGINVNNQISGLAGQVNGLDTRVSNLEKNSGGSSGGGTGGTGGSIDTTNLVKKDDIVTDLSKTESNNTDKVVAASAGHALYNKVSTLDSSVNALAFNVDNFTTDVSTLTGDVATLGIQVEELDSRVNNLGGGVSTLGDKVDELEEALKNFDGTGGGTGVSGEAIADAISTHNESEDSHEDIRRQFNHYLEQIYPTTEKAFNFFVGTREEYEELEDKTNLFAIITDDEVNNNILSNLTPLIKWKNSVMTGETVVPRAESDFSGVPFTQKYLQNINVKYLHQVRITVGVSKVSLDAYFNIVTSYRHEFLSFNDLYNGFKNAYGLNTPILATGFVLGLKIFNIYSVEAELRGSDKYINFIYTDGTSPNMAYSVPSNISITLRDLVLPLANVTWNSGGGSGGVSGGGSN